MSGAVPGWLDPSPWLGLARGARPAEVESALTAESPAEPELAALLSPAAGAFLEPMARRAQALTRRHFGRTMQLYVPLYLSDYCPGGCVYCGFASDRHRARRRLEPDEIARELAALRRLGFDEVLLLTGERTPRADVAYVRDAVAAAAGLFSNVTLEVFPMEADEYAQMAAAGCTGLTLYQETYDPAAYERLHRWGPKRDYAARLDAPARALGAGIRAAGLGALLGLADPLPDLLALYRHARHLMREFWRCGVSLSFPRIRPQEGAWQPPCPVSERFLAQAIFAFRICLPEVHLVLSTREGAAFRDGMAGVGVSKMSAASRTSVGGYDAPAPAPGQFEVDDSRGVEEIRAMLRARGLEPVFKNWDPAYREAAAPAAGGRP